MKASCVGYALGASAEFGLKNLALETAFLIEALQQPGEVNAVNEAIGKSRGGNSTKIDIAANSSGLPVYFELQGEQAHDIVNAQSVIAAPQNSAVSLPIAVLNKIQ